MKTPRSSTGAAAALLCLAVIPASAASPVAAAAIVGAAAAAAGLAGVARYGRRHPRLWRSSWTLIVAGLIASAAGGLLSSLGGSGWRTLGDTVALAGSVANVMGFVHLLRHRLGGRGADVTFEAVMAAAGVGLVACAVAFRPESAAGMASVGRIAALARPLLDLVAVWLAVRLVWLTPTHPVAYRYLLVGLGCLLTGDAITAGSVLAGSDAAQPNAVHLWSLCLRSVAACHPSLGQAFEPVTGGPHRLRRLQLVLVVGLVVLGPGLLAGQVALGGKVGLAVALGSALLPLLVVVHLARQVQERASGEFEAQHDALTGLPNRVLFEERLEVALAQAKRSGTRLAVLFCDLDRFKSINDSLGHAVGNELLRGVGRRLRACLRPADTVARVGGDEFTLLVSSIADVAEAEAVAERIVHEFSTPYAVNARQLFTSVSIGVAVFPDDGTDAETLLKHADTAMYGAKASGRNGHQLYTADMSARVQVKHSLENSLRQAIERRELTLHYQPKVGMVDEKVVGLEALARWAHPTLGWVGPDAFIPVAEETGLIGPLGDWVVEEACRQLVAWGDAGLPLVPVAVNVSARQLLQGDIVDVIARTLSRAGVSPDLLEVEITESVFLHDAKEVTDRVNRLRAMGVRCSIDDFGTGYSGLNYLARMPLDSLKIDRSFVARIGEAVHEEAIVDAVIALGRSLHLKVVAEGVETAGQAGFLRSRGCDQMQGFLFSRPVPPGDIPALLGHLPAGRGPGRHLVVVGGTELAPAPEPALAHLGRLLHAVCSDTDFGTPDPTAVADLVAALEPPLRLAATARRPSVSARLAVGTVASLVPLSGGIAAAGALPGPAQQVISHVLVGVGADAPPPRPGLRAPSAPRPPIAPPGVPAPTAPGLSPVGTDKPEPPGHTKAQPAPDAPGQTKTDPPGHTEIDPPGHTPADPPGHTQADPPGQAEDGQNRARPVLPDAASAGGDARPGRSGEQGVPPGA